MQLISYVISALLAFTVFISNIAYYRLQVMQPINWQRTIVSSLSVGVGSWLIFFLLSK
jgi:hypothetical protein